MSNYSQTTFFTPKDALSTGDPDKVIYGAEVDPELSAISTAIATKVDTADTGLEITSTTVRLSLVDLTAVTPASGDSFVFADTSDSDNEKRVTFANLNAALDHDSLSGFVANEHIDHTSVTLTAGNGLTGGGDISSNRTFAVGAGTGITVNADDVALNTSNSRNADHSAISVIAGTGLTGGGTIAASRTLNVVGGDGITANANDIEVDSTVVRTTGTQSIGGAKTFTSAATFDADVTMEGGLEVQDHMQFSGIVSASLGSGLQNNVVPSGGGNATIWRFTGSGVSTITGISGGTNGRILFIINARDDLINFNFENTSSSASNRIIGDDSLGGEGLAAGQTAMLIYNTTENRWRLVQSN